MIWEDLEKVLGRNNTTVSQVLQRGAGQAQDKAGAGGGFQIFKYMSQLYTSTCAAKASFFNLCLIDDYLIQRQGSPFTPLL